MATHFQTVDKRDLVTACMGLSIKQIDNKNITQEDMDHVISQQQIQNVMYKMSPQCQCGS